MGIKQEPSVHQHSKTPTLHHSNPIVWTIAGTDPSSGAGIQADLKTIHGLGGYGCSVITAVIAQNTQGVSAVQLMSGDTVKTQMEALKEDLLPRAVKLGMLGTGEIVHATAVALKGIDSPIVCDPVIVSSSGHTLLDEEGVECMKQELLPLVTLLTPNTPEAARLLGLAKLTADEIPDAAEQLLQLGMSSVLIKGGHHEYASSDYWTDGITSCWISGPVFDGEEKHGTGCTLSSAIATAMASGLDVLDSIVAAKAYVTEGWKHAPHIGKGHGPLAHGAWPSDSDACPWITTTLQEADRPYSFPPCDVESLRIYPIVDSFDWVKRLVDAGITTIQLRAKHLEGAALEQEVVKAIELGKAHNVHVYINDAWEVALNHGAYGVHLGQDDLPTADLRALSNAGIRLGVSTHSFSEMARGMALNPSYIALGTLFRTTSKQMDYEPLGLIALQRIASLCPAPVIAIGGISLDRATDVLAHGASGIALISDIVEAAEPEVRVQQWLDFYQK